MYSQNITVSAPEVVAEGQQIEISYTINSQNIKNFRVSNDDSALRILNKNNPDRSNKRVGRKNPQYQTTFSYQCIPQIKEGKIELPLVSAVVNGTPNTSPNQKIQIVPKSALVGREDYVATFTLSQNEVFQGELVYAEIKLYFSKDLNSIKPTTFSKVTGLTIIEVPQNSYQQGQSLYNGKLYNHAVASKFEIKTDSAGSYNFPELTVNAVLNERVNNGGIFSTFREKLIPLTTKPITLKVLPVAISKKENYLGVFSELELNSKLPNKQLDADQAVNLSLTLSGKGSFETLKTPLLTALKKQFNIYDPEIVNAYSKKEDFTSGKITYDFTLVPLSKGITTTKPIILQFFNSTTEEIDSLIIPSFSVQIMNAEKEDRTIIKEEKIDFSPIAKESLSDIDYPIISTLKAYWLLLGSVVILFSAVLVLMALQRRTKEKKEIAPILSPIELFRKKSDSLLALAETKEFEGKLIEITESYLMETMNIPKADFNKEMLSNSSKNENINYVIKILTELEMSEFGGSSSSSESLMNKLNLLEKTKSLIENLNSEVNR